MFIDTRRMSEGAELRSTVCIIGAGVAGITLALELAKEGIEVTILESGGFVADEATRDLYRGENVGLPYNFADGYRMRFLGGSSGGWGGWCSAWDPWDFEKRAWVPNSGWPFSLEELAPYYEQSHSVLQLGPLNFDPAFWESAISNPLARRMPLVSGKVRDVISQFSPPTRFGSAYRHDLQRAGRIRVFLHANVTNIETDGFGRNVMRVQVRTLEGHTLYVSATLFVLATGGIENARLMLVSNQVQPAGLGNGHGLVGRYFMDHPRLLSGSVRFRADWARNHLYDIKFHHRKKSAVAALGTRVASQLALEPQVLSKEGLLNSRVWFSSAFLGEGSEGAKAMYRRKQALLGRGQPHWKFGADLKAMASHPVNTLSYGLTRLIRLRSLVRDVKLQTILEPAPDRESRVSLSTERDRLGMKRVRVDWRLGELERRTYNRTLQIIAEELTQNGVAEVSADPPLEEGCWPDDLEGSWHHMGTTRMHDSPTHGVVDRNCRVHDMSNLYIAGSSVFPTGAANHPTITIVALTLRLADHIRSALNHPPSLRAAITNQS